MENEFDTKRLIQLVEERMKELQLNQVWLAEQLGISQPAVSKWMLGESQPSKRNAKRLKELLSISFDELTTEVRGTKGSVVFIPNIKAGAGDGYFNDDIEYVPYSKEELNRIVHDERVKCVRVVGNSMSPTIQPGDLVYFIPTNTFQDFGMYVLRMDDGLLIKNVQRLGGNCIRISSENTKYPPEEFEPTDDYPFYKSLHTQKITEIQIIGKVLFVPTRV